MFRDIYLAEAGREAGRKAMQPSRYQTLPRPYHGIVTVKFIAMNGLVANKDGK